MTEVFVVLGMHRSGTSLTSSILQALGVPMCKRCGKAGEHQPWGYYEDQDFVELNRSILAQAGGAWDNAPSRVSIAKAALQYDSEVTQLLQERGENYKRWGFKDPRTCLTVFCWHHYFTRVRIMPTYIRVMRSPGAVVASLQRRNGGKAQKWQALHSYYAVEIHRFLTQQRPRLIDLSFPDLVKDADTAQREIQRLAKFIGADPKLTEQALERIHFE